MVFIYQQEHWTIIILTSFLKSQQWFFWAVINDNVPTNIAKLSNIANITNIATLCIGYKCFQQLKNIA